MSDEHDSWMKGLGIDVGAFASQAWDGAKTAAGAVYDGYEKATDYKPVAAGEGSKIDWAGSKPISLPQALGAGVDWLEKSTHENNQKMVEQTQGIPVVGQLAQASAAVGDTVADVGGGIVRGAGDIVGGVANVFFHPLDSAAGLEKIVEHDGGVPFLSSTLKAAHGTYDVVTGNQNGEYGNTLGDVASHILDPRKQMEDDSKFNSDLARGILAPGTKDWDQALDKLKENPADTLARAGTNALPIALGLGEAAGGEAAADAANAVPKVPAVEPAPPTLRTPYLPEGVPEPPPFNPDIHVVGPGELPAGPKVINPGGGDVMVNPEHPFYAEPGADTVPADTVPADTLPPDTLRDPPAFPQPPGEPIAPRPVPKLPGGPKEGPPIPREEPPSSPGDTLRQPIDVPGLPPEQAAPSVQAEPPTVPDGPVTQDAPPSSEQSAVPTERGLGGIPAIPRGMDPGALIQLAIDTPGGKSVVELMQELGMPIERR